VTASKPHSEQGYDLANAAQGIKGCDAVYPYDERRAYEGLHRWAELLITEQRGLEEQLKAERVAKSSAWAARDTYEKDWLRMKEQLEVYDEALRAIASMAGAGGSGEIPAMPIAARARRALNPASRQDT